MGRDVRSGLLDIVHPEIVGVIDADKMNTMISAMEFDGLIEKHSNARRLHSRYHPYAVVIAQYAVNISLEMGSDSLQAFQRGFIGAIGLAAIIAGQDTDIVVKSVQKLDHPVHGAFVGINVQIAQMENRESVELRGKVRADDGISFQPNVLRVSPAPPIETGQFERKRRHGMCRV